MPVHPLLPALVSTVLVTTGCSAPTTVPAPPAAPAPPTNDISWTTTAVSAPGVSYHRFESPTARATVSYHIFLPPQYEAEPARRFPVLYWLHGSGGGLAGIVPVSRHFDAAIRSDLIPPMLVVFANGMTESMWADSKDGRVPMETVVSRDLVAEVDSRFRTIATRDGRLLEGFSMGGYGVARIGFRNPDRFGTISALAGGPIDLEFDGARALANPATRARILRDVYGNDMAYYRRLSPLTLAESLAVAPPPHPRIRIVIGSADDTRSASVALHHTLTQLGIAHEFIELPGVGHDALALFAALGDRHWGFYAPGAPALHERSIPERGEHTPK
jgi:enterochelin esterase-like enzyme